jgi:hypothetical protein
VEMAQEVDPSMDFLDINKKIALQKFYSKDPAVMPNKEIRPLRFNKLNKFTAKLENEIDTIDNAVVQTVKSFEQQNLHSSMFHMGNVIEIYRDARNELNLKRLKQRKIMVFF